MTAILHLRKVVLTSHSRDDLAHVCRESVRIYKLRSLRTRRKEQRELVTSRVQEFYRRHTDTAQTIVNVLVH